MESWGNKDWKWLVGVLISIIILVMAGWLSNMSNIINYFSFTSNGVSIVLALVAIYISLSQNNTSQILNSKTTDMLAKMYEKIGQVDKKVNKIDPTSLSKIMEIKMNSTLSQFADNLFEELNTLGIEENKIDEIKKELPQIKKSVGVKSSVSNLKSSVEVSHSNKTVEEQVKFVLNKIKGRSFEESIKIIDQIPLLDKAREILYASLVIGPYKKTENTSDGNHEALEIMYGSISWDSLIEGYDI
ncbi:hypothetical protein [Selenihalanaerobacter shriftii]|uniref:Uncharacterized protein n=1 Tax=Selenihalanaerobacter shriftii TaxID=142842 RepID=A0A1T4Q7N7_9FIRM|nr:hypothetical protein [Selenihalanaerobacter shriftii]SJZ99705.1 hypothetical protein SAMN02745118_02459 [Selenihalanaerobacter shriftii]